MQSFVMLVAVASHLLIELSHKLPSQLTMGGDPLEIIAIDVGSKKLCSARFPFLNQWLLCQELADLYKLRNHKIFHNI